LIGAHKAIGECHGLHTRDRFKSLEVSAGQARSAERGGSDEEHIGAGPGNGLIHASLHAL
jgi:hypothetical protein